ncbi:MAG: hypothetical protein KGJ90_06490 [Patescibacteria group bacterium]|nr:hypothetical protein [Patescibacteria group bacterium]
MNEEEVKRLMEAGIKLGERVVEIQNSALDDKTKQEKLLEIVAELEANKRKVEEAKGGK